MSYVVDLSVYNRADHVDIAWPWTSGIATSAATYTLQRHGSEAFLPLVDTQTLLASSTKLSFSDYEVDTNDQWRRPFYRVTVHLASGNDCLSDVVSYYQGFLDRIVTDIRYRMSLALSAVMGTPAYVFIKKADTFKCPDCWDPILQRVKTGSCQTCFGTGLIGGYYTGISKWVQFQPKDDSGYLDQQGIDQKNVISCLMDYHPYMAPGDLVMDNDFNLYVVTRNQSTFKCGAIAHQMLGLRQLNRDAVEYKMIKKLTPLTMIPDPYVPLTR